MAAAPFGAAAFLLLARGGMCFVPDDKPGDVSDKFFVLDVTM